MRYNDLPEWAKRQALVTVKRWIRENEKEAREAGEIVPEYTEDEATARAMEHLNEQDFSIEEFDEDGQPIPPVVNW